MFTTALSGNGFAKISLSRDPSSVKPSAKNHDDDVAVTHKDVVSPAANSSCCSTIPCDPMTSTIGTTTPLVRPRKRSTLFRDRARTITTCCSGLPSLNNVTAAVISTSVGLAITTRPLSTPSPAATPGQNHDVLIRARIGT